MKQKIISFFILLILLRLITISEIYAASPTPAPPPGGSSASLGCGEGFGFIGKALCGIGQGGENTVAELLNHLVSTIIGFMTIAASVWFVFQFIVGGYQWISSGGDKQGTTEARDKITHSIIGLIVVVIAVTLTTVIGNILGLEITNPGKLILDLGK